MADEQSRDEEKAADEVADAWAAVLIDVHEKQGGQQDENESEGPETDHE